MELSRRRLLQVSLLGMAGAAFGGTAACGGDGKDKATPSGDSKSLALWYWPGGLSEKVLADVPKQFADISFNATKIGDDFKAKLVTTITSRQFLPDITGLKGEDIAYFMSQEGQFLDLRDLGADDLKGQYLEWKWKQGSTPDGKQIGFPIDIGPTALYYRADVYEKAGLPTEPADVAAAMSTWDQFFEAGVKLKAAVPKAFMVVDASQVFGMAVGQSDKRYVDASNKFIGDQDHIRRAWDLAVKTVELGIDGKTTSGGQDFNAALGAGTLPSVLGAAWMALDIKSAAEKTSGKWRVAPMPDGPANVGGSFLAITKNSGNPKKAFEIIKWILSPENQARAFTDAALFPSAPATYAMPALTGPEEFFGGQATIDVFGAAAKNIPVAYESPHDVAVGAPFLRELTNIEAKGKSPEAAWNDAVAEAKKIGERLGVS
jgi:cellobiose transport system substrate-binding protein